MEGEEIRREWSEGSNGIVGGRREVKELVRRGVWK